MTIVDKIDTLRERLGEKDYNSDAMVVIVRDLWDGDEESDPIAEISAYAEQYLWLSNHEVSSKIKQVLSTAAKEV